MKPLIVKQHIMDKEKTFPVIEIFGPTIQGEGMLVGKRTHFIRFGGCGYRCTWCDSMHAVEPELIKANATNMTAIEINQAIDDLNNERPSEWITLSGGDPVMHKLEDTIRGLRDAGHRIAVETQGQLYKDWMSHCELITISPKPPSSGMDDKYDNQVIHEILDRCNAYFKVVIFDDRDLEWACLLHEEHPEVNMHLSVGTNTDPNIACSTTKLGICDSLKDLYEKALVQDSLIDVTILPQLHVLAWGHEKEK